MCIHSRRCPNGRTLHTDFRSGAVDATLLAYAANASNAKQLSNGWAFEPHWLNEINSMPLPQWWREDDERLMPIGACSTTKPRVLTGKWGDCEYGDAGSFRLHGPMRETHAKVATTKVQKEFRSAAIACDWLCRQCGRCTHVSFARRSPQECIWRHSCGEDGGGSSSSLVVDGNVRYRTARVRTDEEAATANAAAFPSSPSPFPQWPTETEGEKALLKRRLILITATYPHAAQLTKLTRCAEAIKGALQLTPKVLWMVAEDAKAKTPEVGELLVSLSSSTSNAISHHHLAVGPTRSKGHAQRSLALQWLKAQRMDGVVYNLDDDNEYHPSLWRSLLLLKPMRVGVLAVGFPTEQGHPVLHGEMVIEGPIYAPGGSLRGFSAGWCHDSFYKYQYGPRFFCVDMGGFAFDARLLQSVKGVPWDYTGRRRRGTNATEWRGGESEFIEQLLPNSYPEDLMPLGNCGHDVLVMHNAMDFPEGHVRAHRMQPAERRVVCRDHGW